MAVKKYFWWGGGGGCQFYVIFIRIFVCFMGLRSNVLFVINITVFVCLFVFSFYFPGLF